MSDVRVLGLKMQTVLIEDIAMDVPHRATVTIPALKAAKSKDLWRLIAQGMLFQLDPRDVPRQATPPPAPDGEVDRLREENRHLVEQNRMLRSALDTHGGKLDAILGMLACGQVAPGSPAAAPSGKPASDVVEIEVPTYIPSEIKPKDVEAHVDVKSETSEGSGVAGAGAALRKFRKGGTR
jgi:hypothetical protein